MADGIFSFLRQDPNQMPQRTFMSRLGSAAAVLNPMNPVASQYGQMMDARLQQRRQEYTRNKSIEELQRRAQGGDKLAERYLSSVQSGALQPGQAFSAYYQQMASEDQFRRQQAAAAAERQRKLQMATTQTNQTVAYLRSIGRNDLASMVEANPALAGSIMGEVAKSSFGPDQAAINKSIVDARKEFTGLKPVKDFADVTFAYSRVVTSAEDPSPAGDLALIFNYMKVLDPGSVVREGEFATAQNAGGVDDRVRSLYNRVVEGTRLSEPQRADFIDRATRLYQGAEQQYKSIADQYGQLAQQAGLPVDQVIPDFTFKGSVPERSTLIQVPENPDRAKFPTDADWQAHWQTVMTEEQRRAYLEG